MAAGVSDWMAAGARVIGGCCGTTPAHLKSIADQVHAHSAN
jgi:S-methylmethionine-dependent homocysteine/selenocysteine methylase